MTASIVIVLIVLGLMATVLVAVGAFCLYAVWSFNRVEREIYGEPADHWASCAPEGAPGASLNARWEDVQ